jgi:hypothetical protein
VTDQESGDHYSRALITAYIALAVGVLNWFNNEAQQKIDEQKIKSNIVLELLKGEDATKIANNMRLMLDAGVLHDRDGALAKYVKQVQTEPGG